MFRQHSLHGAPEPPYPAAPESHSSLDTIERTLSLVEAQLARLPDVDGLQAWTAMGEGLRNVSAGLAALGSSPKATALAERLERATLAYRARCAPGSEELQRRLSHHNSISRAGSLTTSGADVPLVRQRTIDDAVREIWGGGCDRSVAAETPRDLVRMQSQTAIAAASGSGLSSPEIGSPPSRSPKQLDNGGSSSPIPLPSDGMDVDGESEGDNKEAGAESVGSAAAAEEGAVELYSWGRGDQGALLHADTADHSAADALVRLRTQMDIVQVSTSEYHTMALASTGELLGAGSNEEGQVRPDRAPSGSGALRSPVKGENIDGTPENAEESAEKAGNGDSSAWKRAKSESWEAPPAPVPLFAVPTLIEPLQGHKVVAVACGMMHTAVVTASGFVLTWGGNDAGQLGHSEGLPRAQPRTVLGCHWSGQRRAVSVACGDLYTLIVTAAGQVLSCGVGDSVGLGDGKSCSRAKVIPALATVPIVALSAGPRHAVAISSSGAAYSWGINMHGQCGVGRAPPQVPPGLAAGAAAAGSGGGGGSSGGGSSGGGSSGGGGGGSGSARASAEKSAAKGGSNEEEEEVDRLVLAPRRVRGTGTDFGVGSQLSQEGSAAAAEEDDALPLLPIASAACGQNHTVMVTRDGRVLVCGRNRRGALGLSPASYPVVRRPSLVSLDECGVNVSSGGSSERASVRVTRVAAGEDHTLLLTSDGRVLAAGSNDALQLGLSPQAVAAAAAAADLEERERREMELRKRLGSHKAKEQGAAPTASVSSGDARAMDANAMAVDAEVAAAATSPQEALAKDLAALGFGEKVVQKALGSAGTDVDAAISWLVKHEAAPDGDEEAGEAGEKTYLWKFTEVAELSGAGVVSIAAGGSQSFALAVPQTFQRKLSTSIAALLQPPQANAQAHSALPAIADVTQFVDMVKAAPLGSDHRRRLMRAIQDTFSSPNALNASFLTAAKPLNEKGDDAASGGSSAGNSSGASASGVEADAAAAEALVLDVEGLESLYVALLRLGTDVIGALSSAIAAGVAEMEPHASVLSDPEALRCLLAWWQCPIHGNSAASVGGDVFLKLCGILLSLPYEGHRVLMGWVQRLYPSHIFASRLLKPLQQELGRHLRQERGRGPAIPTASLVAQWLYAVNDVSGKVPFQQFYSEAVSTLPPGALFNDLVLWKRASSEERRRRYFFCNYSFLLSAAVKKNLIQMEASTEQQLAAQRSGGQVVLDPQRGLLFTPVRPFLVIQVQRDHLLQQTLLQVAAAPDADLSKEMKVIFVGEEAIDEGGVRKEFFQLLIGKLFDLSYGMFLHINHGRELWFNRDCTWCEEEYVLIGVLMGLAVYNAVLLDVRFPLAVYKKLLGLGVSLEDLEDVDAELLRGLRALLDYQEDDVEDVFCRSFEVSWDDFGQQRSYELAPNGRETPVTSANREDYVKLYVKWVLADSVALQFDAFKRGFERVMGKASLNLLRAEELELLVAGMPSLDFKELEKVAKYEGYSADSPVIKAFWDYVHSLDIDQQRKLLLFVTGGSKAPVGGLGSLDFRIQRAGPDSNNLPTASTCFNVLLLPDYASEDKLKDRLSIALNECAGFGLK